MKIVFKFALGFGLPHGTMTTHNGHHGSRRCRCGCGNEYYSEVAEQQFAADYHKYQALPEVR